MELLNKDLNPSGRIAYPDIICVISLTFPGVYSVAIPVGAWSLAAGLYYRYQT